MRLLGVILRIMMSCSDKGVDSERPSSYRRCLRTIPVQSITTERVMLFYGRRGVGECKRRRKDSLLDVLLVWLTPF